MSLNILVVDDSAVVRKMIIRTLGMAGIQLGEVREAGNGREGLDILENYWADVVLADLNMPVMNGEEMIEQIRSNPLLADLAIVVISTEGSETRIRQLLENNVRFIHKPFTPESIRDVIVELIGVENA
jgi:two-component system, chemotaxis family, chemotaxis protein CheY